MNRVNELVNCAPAEKQPDLLIRHMESLKHFVSKQAEIQEKEIQEWNKTILTFSSSNK